MPLDDLLRLEDLVALDDRERARVGADGLVLRAGEPEDLGAVQAAALADEAHEVRRVLAVLHALVDLAERRLVHRDALFSLAFHY